MVVLVLLHRVNAIRTSCLLTALDVIFISRNSACISSSLELFRSSTGLFNSLIYLVEVFGYSGYVMSWLSAFGLIEEMPGVLIFFM